MNAKAVISTALVWAAVSLGTVRGQTPGVSPLDLGPGGPNGGGGEVLPPPGPAPVQHYLPSAWIRGEKYACCDESAATDPSRASCSSASARRSSQATAPSP